MMMPERSRLFITTITICYLMSSCIFYRVNKTLKESSAYINKGWKYEIEPPYKEN